MKKIAPSTTKEFTVACRAFTAEARQKNKVVVNTNGEISVFDSIAGHFTTNHTLSKADSLRIRKIAAAKK